MINHLRGLAVFAKTVEHGSFRLAARELNLSPSVVSHHISQLEEQLGVALLYRSTRSLSLTRDGEQLIGPAREMLAAAELGIGVVRDSAAGLSGEIHVTAPAILVQSELTDKIARFLRAHPNVKVNLDYSDSPRDIVADGIDVAIRLGWLRDSSLKARKLYEVERVVVASRSYLNGRSLPKSPRDIEGWDWMSLGPVHGAHVFRHEKEKSVTLRPSSRVTVNSALALREMADRGAGLAVLPRLLVDSDVRAGRMVILLPDWSLPSVSAYAVRPSNAPRQGLTAEFVKAIAAEI
ncbi:MAG: LysR family transcriptional regulator [Pseudomonadota bacterium]